ncbi:hypothetical protein JQ625_29850 [Bradyrhizobium diazoefficiens]|nr:hypothetical protein [Bradyrhizobium diazoefficiens]MBR0779045.1 hypothetical protein [Bradyrhizobium diazoefficiens]
MTANKSRAKSENALKHGAYARAVLLPHESRRDHDQLVAETRQEWCPNGPTEEVLVDRLVDLMWRQKRLRHYDQQMLQLQIDRIQVQNQAVPIRVEIKALAPEFAGATTAEEVEKLLAKQGDYGSIIASWVPRPKEIEKESSWGAAIADHLSKMNVGSIVEGPPEITAYVDHYQLEMQDERMERLDERILQVTKRLVQIKASKALFRTRPDPETLFPLNARPRPATAIGQEGRGRANERTTTNTQRPSSGPIEHVRSRIKDVDEKTAAAVKITTAGGNGRV